MIINDSTFIRTCDVWARARARLVVALRCDRCCQMASADDDDFDWGSRECTPSENNVCGEPCDFYDAYATCPSHVSRAGKKRKITASPSFAARQSATLPSRRR